MNSREFECVEPEISGRLRELADSEFGSKDRKLWEAHLEICSACREDELLAGILPRLIAAGVGVGEKIPVAAPLPRVQRLFSGRHIWAGAGVSLAAGLALIFMMSPHRESLHTRGFHGDASRGELVFWIERPVEGEVLTQAGGVLAWTAVEAASSYRITVETMDGDRRWTGTATASRIELPAESKAPGYYSAIVEPVPKGLVPEDQTDVGFRRSSWPTYLFYRLSHAAWASLLPVVLALGLGVLAIFRRN